MKQKMFIKTFLIMVVSFSVVILFSMIISYRRFSPMYIDENITQLKESLLDAAPKLQQGQSLDSTVLNDISSETTFLWYQNNTLVEHLGQVTLSQDEVLDFVIEIYDSEDAMKEDNLTYLVTQVGDIYHINYIYEFGIGDYIIITSRIQSLQNIDLVLTRINTYQSIALFITIILISYGLSKHITNPLKTISHYANKISNLQFEEPLSINRNDEFKSLASSLNEMRYNLQTAYQKLETMNEELTDDIVAKTTHDLQKQQLIMAINHEIKTPLSVMKGMIEGMIDGVGRYKDRDTYLKKLLDQIKTIEHITHDFTYRLRLEDKMNQGDTTSLNILDDIIDTLNELATQHDVTIQHDTTNYNVAMNQELFILLLTNLIKNAIYYTTNNTVTITQRKQDNTLTLIIKNKGRLQRSSEELFQSFVRDDTTLNHKKGSGVGLFVVKTICDLYDYPIKLYQDGEEVITKLKLSLK